jgi:S-adenosylmethionine:tRNA ribosyltransferase-isomerase
MLVTDFDYDLPHDSIAQRPLVRRDDSRLLVVERQGGAIGDGKFAEFPGLLRGDELLVVNNARVIPARLFGFRMPGRESSGGTETGRVEVLLLRSLGSDVWEALVRPGRKMELGQRVRFGDGELEAEITVCGERGLRRLRFESRDAGTVGEHLERLGHVPLPPYIEREDEASDRERYQTVFAKHPGAIAAPTAGLHFTPEILQQIQKRGAEICELTLDVGLGTFQPIRTESLEDHAIHRESYEIPEETANYIHSARSDGRPIVAIGTTVVRALEDAAQRAAQLGSETLVAPGKAEAALFIFPGFTFRVVDSLVTNFHLPRSTLLALVCAFAGRDQILTAYKHAVDAGYRFYSYGDCMFIR